MQTLKEIYSNAILPLSEEDRLKLAEMIVRDIQPHGSVKGRKGALRSAFGTWKGRSPVLVEYDQLDHNEKIDFDLARSYMDAHDDED
ncbi:MAG: hypothetical protein IPM25_12755 [Chloracidobacterium sp.]|nr:hypothetical protein [Chloracidobacterium sp.]